MVPIGASARLCLQSLASGLCKQVRCAGGSSAAASGRAAAPPWSELEAGLLARGLAAYGPDACRIARLLAARTCADVRVQLLARGTGEPAGAEDVRGDLQAGGAESRGPDAGAAAPAPAARGPGNRRKPKEAPRRKHAAAKQARGPTAQTGAVIVNSLLALRQQPSAPKLCLCVGGLAVARAGACSPKCDRQRSSLPNCLGACR